MVNFIIQEHIACPFFPPYANKSLEDKFISRKGNGRSFPLTSACQPWSNAPLCHHDIISFICRSPASSSVTPFSQANYNPTTPYKSNRLPIHLYYWYCQENIILMWQEFLGNYVSSLCKTEVYISRIWCSKIGIFQDTSCIGLLHRGEKGALEKGSKDQNNKMQHVYTGVAHLA